MVSFWESTESVSQVNVAQAYESMKREDDLKKSTSNVSARSSWSIASRIALLRGKGQTDNNVEVRHTAYRMD